MAEQKRRPGDPYEVGFGKPPKHRRFKKGQSGNRYGRPPKKPDLYAGLKSVLREHVTVVIDGEPKLATAQEALLLRLRREVLRGEAWAFKLLQKVLDAIPDGTADYDYIEEQVNLYRAKERLRMMWEDSEREKAQQASDDREAGNAQ